MEFALLTERRRHRPPGGAGGDPGRTGVNQIIRKGDSGYEELEPKDSGELSAGDRLRIETPGGGGWALADLRSDPSDALILGWSVR